MLLALLLAVRVLSPAGFMPAFDHGAVTIIACPDAGAPAALSGMHHHHQGKTKHAHPPCPYASGSSLGALSLEFTPLLDVLILAAALLLGRTFLFIERNNARERPPSRAPPIPA